MHLEWSNSGSRGARNALLAAAVGTLLGVAGAARAADEPKEHRGYTRDAAGKITTISRGAKLNYAADLAATKFGAIDVTSQICFGGSLLSGIKEKNLPDWTFSSSANWDETSFTVDDGLYFYDPNNANPNLQRPRTVDNWTRSWRESAARIPANGFKAHFGVTTNGNNVPAILADKFIVGGQGKETPQYGSSGAGADNRTVNGAAADGGKRYAVLVSWDKDAASDRHGINISRMYNTLTTVYNIPATNIVVLHADGAGNNLGAYTVTNTANGMVSAVQPSWAAEPANFVPVPINGTNTRQVWEDALAGKLFNNGNGADITKDDSLFVYNTGHGGHTAIIEKGALDQKDENDDPISVRYSIADNGNFYRNVNLDSEAGGKASNSFAPGGLFKAQLSFDMALDLSKVKVRIDGGAIRDLKDCTDFASIDLDPLVAGNLQHFRLDNLNAGSRVIPGQTVIDFYNVPAALLGQLGGQLMTAAVLNGGDQECVGVVIPAPGGVCMMVLSCGLFARRRRTR